eukprot:scaffold153552_cov32-Prasinocladus_malaysianus.AAC.2
MSIALPAPPHTPQLSISAAAQQTFSESRTCPTGQHSPELSTWPDMQHSPALLATSVRHDSGT